MAASRPHLHPSVLFKQTNHFAHHTQFGGPPGGGLNTLGVNNLARFDAQGRQTNAAFGQVIAARNERRMQGPCASPSNHRQVVRAASLSSSSTKADSQRAGGCFG